MLLIVSWDNTPFNCRSKDKKARKAQGLVQCGNCNNLNCNKRLTSMRAFSMHLKVTASRHTANFIHYGNYDIGSTVSLDSSLCSFNCISY